MHASNSYLKGYIGDGGLVRAKRGWLPEGGKVMEAQGRRAPLGVLGVSAIGIGSMVGAGIFALLGQAATKAGRDV